MVILNGQAANLAGKTLLEALQDSGFDAARVVVEMDGQVVPRAAYSRTILADEGVLEVLRFVGGG